MEPAAILAVLLSLAAPVRHPEPEVARAARLALVAADQARAVALEVDEGRALFTGPAARAGEALALVAIGQHESGFAEAFGRCEASGDHGRSLTFYQLMKGAAWFGHRREEICPSGVLAARLALRVLHGYKTRCAPRPMSWFRGYASGNCGVPTQAADELCTAWERLARRQGIAGASCWQTAPLKFVVKGTTTGGEKS